MIQDLHTLPVTVPRDLHDAMCDAVSKEFAVSYLCGAAVVGRVLRPRTFTARGRLSRNSAAMKVLEDFGLTLGNSIPEGDRVLIPAVEAFKASRKAKDKRA